MTNIHLIHPKPSLINHIIRVGHTRHRALEDLYTANRVSIKHAVIDAGHTETQSDLINCLIDGGVEIILDTKTAELGTSHGILSSARKLPWAHKNRPRVPFDYQGQSGRDIAESIAKLAIKVGVNTVLSPSHYLSEIDSKWLAADLKMCGYLRNALDRIDGQHIRIDYPLLMPVGLLREKFYVEKITRSIKEEPVENIWLRISNFGLDGSPTGAKRYIEAGWLLSESGKPIIADQVAGLVGIGLSSFGAVGGICHGIAEKENFHTGHWNKSKRGGGGAKRRIYLPSLDLYLQQDKAEAFLRTRGIRSLALCQDCCHGADDMISNHAEHAIVQSNKLIDGLNSIPDLKRPQYFLNDALAAVGRTLRKARRINLDDDSLTKKIAKKSDRLDLMHDTLDGVYSSLDNIPIPRKVITPRQYLRKTG